MTDTALTLITDALLDLGVLADDETPSASQAEGGLRKLNNMLDSWANDNLMVYGAQSYTIQFVAGQQVYTIGPGGNVNIPRPVAINSAYVRDTTALPPNILDTPLYQFTDEEWAAQSYKSWTSTWPNYGVWFNMNTPLIQAYVSPIPSASQYAMVIWVDGMIASFALADPVILAAGYKRCITANLALELAGAYQVQPPATVVAIARDSMSSIKVRNFQMQELRTDMGYAQYYAPENRTYVAG